jgi:hypothetical protein
LDHTSNRDAGADQLGTLLGPDTVAAGENPLFSARENASSEMPAAQRLALPVFARVF